jgi:hypothetical protein
LPPKAAAENNQNDIGIIAMIKKVAEIERQQAQAKEIEKMRDRRNTQMNWAQFEGVING